MILSLILYTSTSVPLIGSSRDEPNILLIDGQGRPIHLTNVNGWDMVVIQNAPDTIVENLVYTDGATILVISSDNLVIRNNTIRNANSYALFAEFCTDVEIYNNTIEGGTNDGLISYGNNNVVIENNRVSGVVKNGIFVSGNNVTISNNQISDIAGTGIFIQSSSDIVSVNNSINDVEWTPIAPDQTSFDSGSFSGNTYNGILLTVDDINPAITNTISSSGTVQSSSDAVTSSSEESTSISSSLSSENTNTGVQSTNIDENENSSTDESYFPFLIISMGMILLSLSNKFRKSTRFE
jgi:parallel beta-helix repeat protein